MKEVNVVIDNYPFKIQFVSFDTLDRKYDGRTYHNDRVIKIRDDLDEITTALVLRHELVHAMLGTQGRCFQRKFDVEDVCEFIAYRAPEIIRLSCRIMYDKNEEEDNNDEYNK